MAWRDAIEAAGSSVSPETMAAANAFARDMKTAGLWEKCIMIDLCAGDNLAAALVRLKVPAGVSRAYTNLNFVSGDYAETTGLTGNGTTKSLDTGLNPVALGWSASSLMLWNYTRTANVTPGVTSYVFGSLWAGANITALGWVSGGSKDTIGIAAAGATEYAGGSATPVTGFLGGGTNGSRSQQFYRNGAPVGAAVMASGDFSNVTLGRFGRNEPGPYPGNYTARTLSSSFITLGMSPAEVSVFYSIVQAFETALGRAV